MSVTYIDAIHDAQKDLLTEDRDVFLYGQDIGVFGGAFKATKGLKNLFPDRARAIATAIEQARLGDIVLIAGKGHENYQELSTGRIDFSDAKEVRRNMFIKEREEFPQA